MSGTQSRTVQVNIVGDSSKLSGAMKKAGDDSQSAGTRISGAWKGVASSLSGAFNGALEPVLGTLDKIGEGLDSLHQKSVGKIMLGVGGAGLAAGSGLQILASKDQAADQQLAQTYQNVGANIDDYKGRINDTVSTMAKYGYTSDQVKSSLNELTAATKNPTQAIAMMSTAANLAAMRHESLDQSTQQLIQVVGGRGTRVMAELGIQHQATAKSAGSLTAATAAQKTAQDKLAAAQQHLSDLETIDHGKKKLTISDQIALRNAHEAVAKAQQTLVDANAKLKGAQDATGKSGMTVAGMLDAISQRTKGQASAAADTYSGRLRALRAEIENHVAAFGQKYGPAIQAASAGLTLMGGVTETVSGIMSKFKGGEEAVTAAEGLKTAAEGADTAAEAAEAAGATAADAASLPLIVTVGLIVAAAAALGVGIYELVTHWSQAWGFIKSIVVDAWHGIDNHFINPIEHFFEGIGGFIKSHIVLIATILTGPFGLAVTEIATHFDQIVGFVKGIPGRIAGFAEHMWDGISNSFKGVLNIIIGAWDWIADHSKFSLPSFDTHIPGIGKIGGGTIGPILPDIPKLAEGGIAMGPTLAMIGDNRSGREAIVPLEKAGQFGFGGGDVVVPIELSIDGRKFGRATARYTRDELARGTARNARKVGLA